MIEPYLLTASEVLSLIANDSLTVETYALSLLSRIRARDPVVKAWVYLSEDLVLSEARKLDALPREKRGPLHGLPVGVKDVILTKDMPTAHNSPIHADAPPGLIDAAPIITLRALGALIFGKTTTTEFAAVVEGGPTCNPHDASRTPGGSSSGSGAAVGDFQVPIALGTQTGGSTVRPGSFNGVWAFKPTWGAISREGLTQYSMTCDTLGLYARCASDLELLAKAFQIADDEPVPATPFSLQGARIAFVKTHVWPKAGPGTRAAWERAKEILEQEGVKVQEVNLPGSFEGCKEWHADVLAGEGRSSFLGNYLLAKLNDKRMSPGIVAHVENPAKLTRKAQLDAYDGCAALRPVWDELASKYDAVITPSVVDEAPLGIENTGDASFCSMWTILQVPCLNIPGFAGDSGLPIGLTLVGPRYHDQRVLYVGKAIGEVFEAKGGFKLKLP